MSQALSQSASPPLSATEWRHRFKHGYVFGLLESTSRLKLFLETSRAACLGVAAFVATAVLAVFVDAVLALPRAGLILVDAVLVLAVAAAAALTVRQWLRNRFDPRRTARLLEERLGVRNSVFINAVDFAESPPRGDSPLLRDRAIRMAEERAFSISSLAVISFKSLYRAMAIAAGAAALAAILWCLAPRAFGMVVPRLLDPTGDHPPYTLVEFDLRIAPEPVYYGKPATISATLSGPIDVERATVVFVGEGANESVAMYPSGERQFALRIDRPESSRRFFIDTPSGRSETMSLVVVEAPFFEEVRVAYRYPAYTGWPGHEHRLDARGLRALVGTELTLTVRSNLALQAGRVVLHPKSDSGTQALGAPTTVTLAPLKDDPKTVAGAFPIEFSGRFELSITSTGGVDGVEKLDGPITAIPDHFPSVSIVSPASYVAVVENWKVPITVEALDDIGIARLRLYRSVNGWGPSVVDLPLERPQPNSARARSEFDLPTLGARAGDIITYYVSAYDNHPSGTQFRDTDKYVIQIISSDEYLQFARQQFQMDELMDELRALRERLDRLQKQREGLLDELAGLRKRLKATEKPNEELQRQMQELEEKSRKYAEAAQKLAQNLQDRTDQLRLYEVEEPYLEILTKMSQQLRQQSDKAQQVSQALAKTRDGPTDPQSVSDLEQAEQQLRDQTEPFSEEQQEQLDASTRDMELYKMADSLLGSADRMRSIIQRQRELADRMAEFRDQQKLTSQDQARADRYAKDQELLEQDLAEAVEQMRKAAEASRERLPQMSSDAMKLCDKIGEMGISKDQRQAAQKARSGAGGQSHDAAESAANKLESLLSQCANCQGAANSVCQGVDGPLALSKERVQQALNQLAQGRGVPGLGGKPGQGRGTSGQGGIGTSGQAGRDGASEGATPQWGPGQSFPGSQAPITILGPHTMKQFADRESRSGKLGEHGRGQWIPLGGGDDARGAETLNPETLESTHSAAGNLRGVPVPYRAAAEAYFRRMAEEK